MSPELEARYASTLKHPDTEETIDLWFYRPVGFRCALWAERWGITPNAITIASILLGVACGVLCYPSDWRLNLLGIFLLVLADIGDSADGQLARLTKQHSRLGRILDGAAGDIWFITIYVAICLRLTPEWGIWIWLLAAIDGAGHSLQAAIADYYRQFHLFFVKGRSGSELDDAQAVVDEYRSLRLANDPLYKIFMWFYKNYTLNQERLTPRMQAFRHLLRERFGTMPVPPALCDEVRGWSLRFMPAANFMSFNSRAILLFLALMAGRPEFYFIVELIVWNIVLVVAVYRHERHCARMVERLTAAS